MGFAEPGQEMVEARSVSLNVLVNHPHIGVIPSISAAAFHENDLEYYYNRNEYVSFYTFASGNCLKIIFHNVQAGWSRTASTF